MDAAPFPRARDSRVVGGAVCWVLTIVSFAGQVVWRVRPWIGVSGAVVGVVGLAAFLLLVVAPTLGPGPGLRERVADEPAYVWLIAVGAGILLAVRAPRAAGVASS